MIGEDKEDGFDGAGSDLPGQFILCQDTGELSTHGGSLSFGWRSGFYFGIDLFYPIAMNVKRGFLRGKKKRPVNSIMILYLDQRKKS
jgi:hypothetical protein